MKLLVKWKTEEDTPPEFSDPFEICWEDEGTHQATLADYLNHVEDTYEDHIEPGVLTRIIYPGVVAEVVYDELAQRWVCVPPDQPAFLLEIADQNATDEQIQADIAAGNAGYPPKVYRIRIVRDSSSYPP